jgi:hypothetical protein
MKYPAHKSTPTVKRRKSDLILDKAESAAPLVIGLVAFWLAALYIIFYLTR